MSQKLLRNPPFRAEHLGSLLRPSELLEVRKAVLEDGIGTQADLVAAEDRAIRDVVALQQEAGFSAVNDGEYRRSLFLGSFFLGLEGYEEVPGLPVETFRTYLPDTADFLARGEELTDVTICTGNVRHVGSTYVDAFNFLKSLVPAERQHQVKLTLTSPYWYHYRYKGGKAYPNNIYPSDVEFFADMAKAYRTELDILYQNGCRNVQIDDPYLTSFCSEKVLAGFKADGEDPDALLDSYIKLYDACLSQRPKDFHIGIHLCRGNFIGGRHFTEGSYDRIAIKLFNEINVNTYYLEYDSERAGGFEPLKHLPKNKNVILGVITSKFPKLEDLEEMKQRVYQAADFVAQGSGQTREEALKRLGVSPQCGFASHVLGNAMTRNDMVAKLKLVRQLADSIWPGEP